MRGYNILHHIYIQYIELLKLYRCKDILLHCLVVLFMMILTITEIILTIFTNKIITYYQFNYIIPQSKIFLSFSLVYVTNVVYLLLMIMFF